MSRRNREKRAAKQKVRRQTASAGSTAGPDPTDFWGRLRDSAAGPDRAARRELMIGGLRNAAVCTCNDDERHVDELLLEFAAVEAEVDAAADTVMTRMIGEAWQGGWQPADIVEAARRRCDPAVAVFLAEAVVVESRRYAAPVVHPLWRAQLAGIAATVEPPVGDAHLRSWTDRAGIERAGSLVVAVGALRLLCSLHRFERLLPLPGESRHQVVAPQVGEVDQRQLAKVRALLAKAESTEFPDEAEALSAKAQELMSRYSLHQAVHDRDAGRASVASGRRIWLDAPYLDAKSLLVQEVANANRARMVWTSAWGFATVIGADADLNSVELLVTSLLVQAGRAMLAEGSQITRSGQSRTRSFRQSFLIAYATRIGERLVAANSTATAEVSAEIDAAAPHAPGAEPQADSRLLPVLAARSRAADDLTDQLFPSVVKRGLSASNHAGYVAGRAAADQAQFGVKGSIAR